jgi:hypothetical protein
MKPPRRLADSVLASIREFERACRCEKCQGGAACVACPDCIELMTTTISQVLGLGGSAPFAVADSTQRSLFTGQVIEIRPREKKPCKQISASGERKA